MIWKKNSSTLLSSSFLISSTCDHELDSANCKNYFSVPIANRRKCRGIKIKRKKFCIPIVRYSEWVLSLSRDAFSHIRFRIFFALLSLFMHLTWKKKINASFTPQVRSSTEKRMKEKISTNCKKMLCMANNVSWVREKIKMSFSMY